MLRCCLLWAGMQGLTISCVQQTAAFLCPADCNSPSFRRLQHSCILQTATVLQSADCNIFSTLVYGVAANQTASAAVLNTTFADVRALDSTFGGACAWGGGRIALSNSTFEDTVGGPDIFIGDADSAVFSDRLAGTGQSSTVAAGGLLGPLEIAPPDDFVSGGSDRFVSLLEVRRPPSGALTLLLRKTTLMSTRL